VAEELSIPSRGYSEAHFTGLRVAGKRRCADTQFDPKIVEVLHFIPESHWIDLRESLGSPFRLTHEGTGRS
jgi:hypothetical protein